MVRNPLLFFLGTCTALCGIAWAASYRNNLDIMQAVWPVSRVAAWSHHFLCDQWWMMRWASNPKSQFLIVSSKGRLTLMYATETTPDSAASVMTSGIRQKVLDSLSLPSGVTEAELSKAIGFIPIPRSEKAIRVSVKGSERFGFGFEELLHDSGTEPSDLFGGQVPQSFRVYDLFFPFWAMFFLLALWPGMVLIRWGIRHFRAYSGGSCSGCGYDLTGLMSTRCPECGKALPSRRNDIGVPEPAQLREQGSTLNQDGTATSIDRDSATTVLK